MLDFKPQKMVGWFDIKQLAGTAVKAGLSTIFGAYADKRETIAAISEFKKYDYSDRPELWIDYIADLGDGFNSTYSMAYLLAQPVITVSENDAQQITLPKSNLVIMGGDQVYPVATRESYNNRFKGPYESAWPRNTSVEEDDLFALPGNHDWYDGLTNFMKLFCQGRTTGNWRTKQNRSYFAIKLNANTWLWGIDIQLDADIDKPQLDYFDWVVANHMQDGNKIILCSAEPSWIYNTSRNDDQTYKNLSFFECRYTTGPKNIIILVSLAGDLHHYAHYIQKVTDTETYHKVTAGGGGAFMHPTHNLPEKLDKLREGDFTLQKTFPDKPTSRKMTYGNVKFFYHNWGFGGFMALIYLLFAWLLEIGSKIRQADMMGDLETAGISRLPHVLKQTALAMINFPPVVILVIIVITLLWKFCDTDSSRSKYIGVLGVLHGLLHACLMLTVFWTLAYFNMHCLGITSRWLKILVLGLEIFFIGGLFASWLMAAYLMIANLRFKIHDNETFSAMKIEDYKNFLRMQVKNNVLTIFSIGVRKTATWTEVDGKFKTDKNPEPELIEKIVIPLG